MAMEEAGLEVETPVGATPIAAEEEVAALDEVVDAGEDEGAELVKGVEAVTEVQEGLEALVASMESALADPYYSPREYQLQVNHAQALLKRLGIGGSPTISTESIDSARLSMESFAEKAKKLGKVVAEYIKKFIEWIQTKFKAGLKALSNKARAVVKMAKSIAFKEVEFEYEIHDFAAGFEFDPNEPTTVLSNAYSVLYDFNEHGTEIANKIVDAIKAGERNFEDKVLEDFEEVANQLFSKYKLPGKPKLEMDQNTHHFKFSYEQKTETFESTTKKISTRLNENGVVKLFADAEKIMDHTANVVMKSVAKNLYAQDTSTSDELVGVIKSLVVAINAVSHYCYRLMSFNIDFVRKYLLVQEGKSQELILADDKA